MTSLTSVLLFLPNRKVTLVMVGLDNAGKTATVRGIQGGKIYPTTFSAGGVSRPSFFPSNEISNQIYFKALKFISEK